MPVRRNVRGVVHLLPVLVIAAITAGVLFALSPTKPENDSEKLNQKVLSKGSEDGDSSGSSSGSSGSDSSEPSDSSGSGSGDGANVEEKTETVLEDGTVIRREVKDGEVRTETRFPSGIRVKTREEEDRTRVDIYEGGTKLRLEREDDRLIVKLENEEGEEVELPEQVEDEIFKIEEKDEEDIKISLFEQGFLISRGALGARTDFPVTVDLLTNELKIVTPAGEKIVTVLPDRAVFNMLVANVINQVQGLPFTEQVGSGLTLEDIVDLLITEQGVLAYEIPGISNQKFLGFLPVGIAKTAVVSVDTGELLEVEQPILMRLLDAFSLQ